MRYQLSLHCAKAKLETLKTLHAFNLGGPYMPHRMHKSGLVAPAEIRQQKAAKGDAKDCQRMPWEEEIFESPDSVAVYRQLE